MDAFCLSEWRFPLRGSPTSHPASSVKPDLDPATPQHLGSAVRVTLRSVLQEEPSEGAHVLHMDTQRGKACAVFFYVLHV
ncbi:uncharacterized [Tachysurus ichikawai]